MIVLQSADTILARGPRYWGGKWADARLDWSDADQAALFALCGAGAAIEASADALARAPKALAHRALHNGIRLPNAWRQYALTPAKWQARLDAVARREERRHKRAIEIAEKLAAREAHKRGLLQYPYVADPAPEHLDLLVVNDLVPKGIPEWIRADICQNIMLAVLEGEITIAKLKEKRESAQYFIRRFYREEVDHKLVSFDHRDDERAYTDIAASVARDHWDRSEMNDRRRSYEVLGTFASPTQIGAVYHAEIRRAQKRAHESGTYLSFRETEHEVVA